MTRPFTDAARAAVHTLLRFIGDNPEREGLRDTPVRVLKALEEMTSGYEQDPASVLKVFEDGACDEMVLVKDISVWSLCEHHLLPFHGVAHVAYLPSGRIVGLSKIPRLVEVYARRLQVQERLTTQVSEALMSHLKPRGAACVIECTHLCMCARGVRQQGTKMVTSSLLGEFRSDPAVRSEFFSLINGRK